MQEQGSFDDSLGIGAQSSDPLLIPGRPPSLLYVVKSEGSHTCAHLRSGLCSDCNNPPGFTETCLELDISGTLQRRYVHTFGCRTNTSGALMRRNTHVSCCCMVMVVLTPGWGRLRPGPGQAIVPAVARLSAVCCILPLGLSVHLLCRRFGL